MLDEYTIIETPGTRILITIVAPMDVNSIWIVDKKTRKALVVDPGGEGALIMEVANQETIEPQGILLTHAHFDHVTAVDEVAESISGKTQIQGPLLSMHADDQFLFDHVSQTATFFGVKTGTPETPIGKFFVDGETILLGETTIQILHTPGHSPGSCCFYLPTEEILIAGDTLFAGGVGRTDLPGGSMATLRKSIREKLYRLPDDVTVIPGHGPQTTIGTEKKVNAFVQP